MKAAERRKMIDERCGKPKSKEGLSEGITKKSIISSFAQKCNRLITDQLRALCKEYHDRIYKVESAKYDLEKEVEFKDYQINELNIAVNDLRGKL